jgi:hypothetical protein
VVWLADANTYLNVVTVNKPKMLTGLPQKGMEEAEELSALLS